MYRYLDDGWLKPDNNTAENAIRPLCSGKEELVTCQPCLPSAVRQALAVRRVCRQ
ncbi:MAG: transposase [Deltaproteobacteria bacterium]|nr:transposase [Deltaproteobacteria bacterium]MBW2027281.1 transposase [Deltaproteobacteria bacterium]